MNNKLGILLLSVACLIVALVILRSSEVFERHDINETVNSQRTPTNPEIIATKPETIATEPTNSPETLGWVPDHVGNSIQAGGIKITVGFAKPLDGELASAIVYDLNLVYGHLTEHDFYRPDHLNRTPSIEIDGRPRDVKRIIQYAGKGRFFPKEHLGKIGLMVDNDMIIPSSLIESYKEAWNRKEANPEEYGKLLESLDHLNNLAERGVADPNQWFYIHEDGTSAGIEIPDIPPDKFVQTYSQYKYRKPSLLDVVEGSKFDTLLTGKFVAKIYIFSEGDLKKSFPPMVYDNGMWKFLVTRPLT